MAFRGGYDDFEECLKDCILKDREPEPSAAEGTWDVQIIHALYESARTGRLVEWRPCGTSPDRIAIRPSAVRRLAR